MIRFREDVHRYYLNNQELMSVTKFIETFETPFDTEYWSFYKAAKDEVAPYLFKIIRFIMDEEGLKNAVMSLVSPNTYQKIITKQIEYKIAWETKKIKAAEKGSRYHQLKEEEGYNKGYNEINDIKADVSDTYYFKLSEAKDGFYQEVLLYSGILGIAGTADKLIIETKPDGRWIYIDDYKTNEKIDTSNVWNKYQEPISHLDQCKLNKYMLQVSMYAYLAELQGFKIGGVQFTHHPIDENLNLIGKTQVYQVRYAREEIISMINYRRNDINHN